MTLTNCQVSEYFAPHSPWLWDWADRGEVVAWTYGDTIAFRQEITVVLHRLEAQGLPLFGAIVLLLGACREGWDADAFSQRILKSQVFAGAPTPASAAAMEPVQFSILTKAITGLKKVHELRSLCKTADNKAELVAIVFEDSKANASRELSKKLKDAFQEGLAPEVLRPDAEPLKKLLFRDLLHLARGLERIDPKSLALRLKTGLDQDIQPAELQVPGGEAVRDLIRELEFDIELGGVARLAKMLLAAVQLPRRLSDPDQMPVGGVSDISNRGPLDRLILSELAYDDLTLAVRIAMNESLYLRREPLARPMARQRLVLIDTGLRMWGVPRVFATAVGMALAAQADNSLSVRTYRAAGDQAVPIDFGTAEGITEHLAQLEHHLHPGAALPAMVEMAAASSVSSELTLIVSEDALADREFTHTLANSGAESLHIATVNREGDFQLLHRSTRGTKVLRTASYSIQQVLKPRSPRVPTLIDNRVQQTLPAIFGVAPFPLRLSTPVSLDNSWYVRGVGTLTVTADGRLLCWDLPIHGAKQLATGVHPGFIQWCSHEPVDDVVTMVLGRLSKKGLYSFRYNLKTGKQEQQQLQLNQDSPKYVEFLRGMLVVVFEKEIEAFDPITGQLRVQCLQPYECPHRGLFFSPTYDPFQGAIVWVQLTFDGEHLVFHQVRKPNRWAHFHHLFVSRIDDENPSLLGLTHQGELHHFESELTSDIQISEKLPQFAMIAQSRDRRRVLLQKRDAPNGAKWLVDLSTAKSTLELGNPQEIVERPIFSEIRLRATRSRFCAIGVDSEFRLVLITPKDTCWPIGFDANANEIVFSKKPIPRHQVNNVVSFEETEQSPNLGRQLSVATWPNGSRAILDKSGLLHLHSHDDAVSECTIVIHEGATAVWVADGTACGSSYFFVNEVLSNLAGDIYQDVIRAFVDRLR